MNITQIETSVTELLDSVDKNTFIYDLLLAYGKPKSSIKRLQTGNLNMSKTVGEVSWKKEVFFKTFEGQLLGADDLDEVLTNAIKTIKHKQRFVIVTDFKHFLAMDTKTIDRLDIEFKDLAKHYAFFLPWAGMEKAQYLSENPADVKAAERMAKLFDEIKKDNPDNTPEAVHHLNVFLSRLLFCFFAEDTNIFDHNLFTNAIASHTQKDGSDVHLYLDALFDVLNLPEGTAREQLPEHLKNFPYVNGGLFVDKIDSPTFSKRSRQLLIDSGELDWKGINPDIFGSMFQAVIATDQRGTLGQHYTSVPNIMKVIQPLFLDELYETYEKAKGNNKKINELLLRLTKIKIFDPACGSGNFLIIAYKELRKLEMKIFKETGQIAMSGISLSQFYGIEIDDFAHEIAILALWLAEHQMNVEFFNEFGRTNPTLPLKAGGNIVQGNACRLDWEEVCPKEKEDEIYILGNPPYVGSKNQNSNQKEDIKIVLDGLSKTKSLDYIACWFIKSAIYINENSSFSFVSTNSLFQGTQVPLIWPIILENGGEIFFANKNFSWSNNAKNQAGVICTIVGVTKRTNRDKFIFTNDLNKKVKYINPYLVEGKSTFILNRTKALSNFPRLQIGNEAYDSGYFTLTDDQKIEFETLQPKVKSFLKPIVGSMELIRGIKRWCIWITDERLNEALEIDELKTRVESVRDFRENGGMNARSCAHRPHQFRWVNRAQKSQIVLPVVSSERRKYIPMSFIDAETIIINSAQVIYDPEPYIFSVLNSVIHMCWVKFAGGKLKTDYRYNAGLCYNTFPFPKITNDQKYRIEESVKNILKSRANHSELTLAQMYDPDKMPDDLREAHHQNDLLIDSCYRAKPFGSDEERLEHLFKRYEKMIAAEQSKIEKEKSKTKRKSRQKKLDL